MRYIGNKTRLLPFIRDTISRLGIEAGSAHDAFSGTAAVGRALKESGWRVHSSDLMTYSHVFQRAYVVANRVPRFSALRAGDAAVRRSIGRNGGGAAGDAEILAAIGRHLAGSVEPRDGFVHRNFSPAGGRMFFTEANARRIDGARETLHEWLTSGLLDETGHSILLAALVEGADRVANTAGVYAAYIKSWQPNAKRALSITPVAPVRGRTGSSAFHGGALEAARAIGRVDLLYLDPPYNARQYSGYYHVPELIARGWFGRAGAPSVRGTTGLPALRSPRSDWCSARRAGSALSELLDASGAKHALLSYNTEGLLPDEEVRAILQAAAADGEVRCFPRGYRRYRSDSDNEHRRYRSDGIQELLYHVRLR